LPYSKGDNRRIREQLGDHRYQEASAKPGPRKLVKGGNPLREGVIDKKCIHDNRSREH